MDEVIIKTTQTIKGLFSVALPPGEYEAGYNKNGGIYKITARADFRSKARRV